MIEYNSNLIPKEPGIYKLHLKEGSILQGIEPQEDRLLYIGKAEKSLRKRLRQHFSDGSTGSSTERRTIGAILKYRHEEYRTLRCIPRGNDNRGFKFTEEGEAKLTAWMKENLLVSVETVGLELIKGYERRLIYEMMPPLNLIGWNNPMKLDLKSLSKQSRFEAQQNRGE